MYNHFSLTHEGREIPRAQRAGAGVQVLSLDRAEPVVVIGAALTLMDPVQRGMRLRRVGIGVLAGAVRRVLGEVERCVGLPVR